MVEAVPNSDVEGASKRKQVVVGVVGAAVAGRDDVVDMLALVFGARVELEQARSLEAFGKVLPALESPFRAEVESKVDRVYSLLAEITVERVFEAQQLKDLLSVLVFEGGKFAAKSSSISPGLAERLAHGVPIAMGSTRRHAGPETAGWHHRRASVPHHRSKRHRVIALRQTKSLLWILAAR